MRRFTIIIGCCMLLVTLQFIFSCVDSKDRKKISIAYANWAEGIAMTNLAKVILEDQGYRVTLKMRISPRSLLLSLQEKRMCSWMHGYR